MATKKTRNLYVFGITLVATLGGLLFGYDTAVISGTVQSLEANFVTPLIGNTELAESVIVQYRIIIIVCFLLVSGLVGSFFFKLFDKKKAIPLSLLLMVIAVVVCVLTVWDSQVEVTEGVLNSIKGFTVSSALVGCIIGGTTGGYISQSLGRKKGLILAAILFMISAIGSAFPDYLNLFGESAVISSFIIFRVIGGIGVGIASMLAPMYIAEIAPHNIRGELVSWNQFAIIFGMLVVYFVNYAIASQGTDVWLNEFGWRYMLLSESIPAGLFLLFLFFVPETPRFLVLANREEEALETLKKIHPDKDTVDHIMHDIKKSLQQKRVAWLSFGGILIVVGIFLSVFQQFVGINVVLYYAPEIFKSIGFGTNASLIQTIIVGAVNLSFTVVAIRKVDKFGRKPLMMIGALGMAVSMFALGLAFYTGFEGVFALVFMLMYIAFFAMSWGPVTWVLLSEIFPNSIKGAMSIAVAAQWLANLIVSWTFPMMNDSTWLTNTFNHGFAYWIYGLMGLLAALFVWKLVPETKNKTLEEMEFLWEK